MHDPIVRIKELATTPKKEAAQEMFVTLFALEKLLDEKEEPTAAETMKNPALTSGKLIRT
jgi:glutamyl-tRNA reductase